MANTGVSRRAVARVIAAKLLAEPERREEWLAMAAAFLVARGQADRAEQLVTDIAREVHKQSGTLLASVTAAHQLSGRYRASHQSIFAGCDRCSRCHFEQRC